MRTASFSRLHCGVWSLTLCMLPTSERLAWSFRHVPLSSGQASLRTSMLSMQGAQNVTGTPRPSPRYQLFKPHNHQPLLNWSMQISLTLQVRTSLRSVTGCPAGQRSFPAPLAPPTLGLRASLDASIDSATFGVPEVLSSDGGPEFTSNLTREFLKRWGVTHRISTAYNPQSNGRAEVAVKAMKRLLRSNIGPNGSLDSDRFIRALLQQWNTPDPDCNILPAQVLFGKPLQDSLSFVNWLEKLSNPLIRWAWREAWMLKESSLQTVSGGH